MRATIRLAACLLAVVATQFVATGEARAQDLNGDWLLIIDDSPMGGFGITDWVFTVDGKGKASGYHFIDTSTALSFTGNFRNNSFAGSLYYVEGNRRTRLGRMTGTVETDPIGTFMEGEIRSKGQSYQFVGAKQ